MHSLLNVLRRHPFVAQTGAYSRVQIGFSGRGGRGGRGRSGPGIVSMQPVNIKMAATLDTGRIERFMTLPFFIRPHSVRDADP